jgi:hypothetical protein
LPRHADQPGQPSGPSDRAICEASEVPRGLGWPSATARDGRSHATVASGASQIARFTRHGDSGTSGKRGMGGGASSKPPRLPCAESGARSGTLSAATA